MYQKFKVFESGDIFLLGTVLGVLGTGGIVSYTSNSFHTTDKVQPGYVATNKLEISLQKQGDEGLSKTVLTYDGKDYLLRLDQNGMPTVQPYINHPKVEADYK